MKRNINRWFLAGMVVLATACSSDPSEQMPQATSTPEKGSFGVRVGGESTTSTATRAEYDGVTYRWSPRDRMGFYMVPAGGSSPVIANAPFESTNTTPAQFTDFNGELTEAQISAISPETDYEYYSYYPHAATAADAGFPNVAFILPGTMTMTPDVFPDEYGFMVGEAMAKGGDESRPVTWLDDGQQCFGEYVGFRYRHVFAYLEVYLALNLMSQPIGKVVVTCTDGSAMAGTAHVNLKTGEMNFVAGQSSSITVNIAGGGLDITSDAQGNARWNKIWIPIDPRLAGKEFRFDFYSAVDARNVSTSLVSGKPLQAGMKHKAGMITSWNCNFVDLDPRPNSWDGDNITHRGYSFWRNRVNLGPNEQGFWPAVFSSENWNPFEGAVIYFNGDNGQLETPAIQIANSMGLTGVNVRVTFTASGNAATGSKHIQHGFTKSGVGSTLTGQSNLDLNSARAYSFTGDLSPDTPNIKFQGFTWGYYWIYMQNITVEYAGSR